MSQPLKPILHDQKRCWIMLNASAGSEGNAMLPLEMINEGYKASSPGMMVADVRFKGGLYVELNHTNQHVEYIYVNTIATTNYEAFCAMAYDVPARSNTSTELVIDPGTCSPVPGKQKQDQCNTRQPNHQQDRLLFAAQCHAAFMLTRCSLAE